MIFLDDIPDENPDEIDAKYDSIIYDMPPKELTDMGFQLYYKGVNSEITNDNLLENNMLPPENSALVFMGCNKKGENLNGIISTPQEIFDLKGNISPVFCHAKL
mgnify:CR=1 FL=1